MPYLCLKTPKSASSRSIRQNIPDTYKFLLKILYFYLVSKYRIYLPKHLRPACRWSERNPRPFHVGFVVDEMTLGQVFLGILPSFPVSIIPPMLRTYFSFVYQRCKVIFVIETLNKSLFLLHLFSTVNVIEQMRPVGRKIL
jgi:hypothetical protein